MIKRISQLVVFLFILSLGFAEVGYNTIYLMEFDNLKNDFTNSHLKEALPDLIKENYKFREDIQVEYAGDIRPYLEQKVWTEEEQIKGLIINGRFQTLNNEFFIEFEAYDIHTWKQLVKRQIFCPLHDIICLHDGFLMAIEQSISPFLSDALDVDATILSLKQKPQKRKPGSYDLDAKGTNENLNQLGNLNEYGTNLDLGGGSRKQGQYGSRYYREFNFTKIFPDENSSKKKNTVNLITILDQILTNPYDVIIGDLSLIPDPRKPGNMMGEIPVEYSVRSALAQDMFTSLPHERLIEENGNVRLQFLNKNFIFDEALTEKLALMKYQVIPVIFFNNKIGGVQFIILDSWSNKFNRLEIKRVPMFWENQFKPLFALTPGADNIQLNLDEVSHKVVYHFSIPYEKIGDYTKVTVKFMQEIELEKLLDSQIRGG